jgi:hypothetical protein
MRNLILKMSISVDGFVGGPDGEIKWVFDSDPGRVKTAIDAMIPLLNRRGKR